MIGLSNVSDQDAINLPTLTLLLDSNDERVWCSPKNLLYKNHKIAQSKSSEDFLTF